MADNLNVHGIDPQEPANTRRLKPRGKRRKPYKIEVRYVADTGYKPIRVLKWMFEWRVWGAYETQEQRDQAFNTLVEKSKRESLYRRTTEWRKVDPV